MMWVMSAREDWPFGLELQRRREEKGLKIRPAAQQAGLSEARWRQLEKGFYPVQGQKLPIKTRAVTVAAVARVVDWDVTDALRTAGMDPDEYQPDDRQDSVAAILRIASDDELVYEVSQRLARAARILNGVEVSPDDSQALDRTPLSAGVTPPPDRRIAERG